MMKTHFKSFVKNPSELQIERRCFIYRKDKKTEHIQTFNITLSVEDILAGFELNLGDLNTE